MEDTPRLYGDLAGWWPLLSPPDEYAEEAEVYRQILLESATSEVRRVLELGSGGGNNAYHLKAHFSMTLVDRSEPMLTVSRALNPDCAHTRGDMRAVRLGEVFDAVFLHDALSYLTVIDDLFAVARTAREHCSAEGVALFVPDFVAETFQPGTEHGGRDEGTRGLRYLEWVWDPDPGETTLEADMVYLLREGDQVSVVHDRHPQGLFPIETWLAALSAAGFQAEFRTGELSDGAVLLLFVGSRDQISSNTPRKVDYRSRKSIRPRVCGGHGRGLLFPNATGETLRHPGQWVRSGESRAGKNSHGTGARSIGKLFARVVGRPNGDL